MEYYVLLLLVGLFHTVICASESGECNDQLLNDMNKKIDRLETLLYQVLVATNYKEDKQSQFNVCTLESKNDQSCNEVGEIKCKSIDLFAKTSACKECIAGNWQSDKSCKPYYATIQNESIMLENDYVIVTIYKNGTSSGEIIENGLLNEECNCSCTWSKYSYDGTNLVPDEKKLLCNEGQYDCYCIVEEAVCFKKKGNCVLKSDEVSCTAERYEPSKSGTSQSIFIETGCEEKMKEHLLHNCSITIFIHDEDKLTNIVIENGKHQWSDVQVNITCPDGKPELLYLHKMCEGPTRTPETSSSEDDDDDNDDDDDDDDDDGGGGLISSTLLIIIIVILVLILVSYYGYHNQWHQKIYSYVNGTEAAGEARPAPSNRRGRMKGKYAPLPRAMEETVPCHAD